MKNDSKLFVLIVVFLMTSFISLSSSMSLMQQLIGIFGRNTKTRANLPFDTQSTASLIMRGVEGKRCEDALCLDCVPGFCRERPVRPSPTIGGGFPNLTISALPALPTASISGPNTAGNGGTLPQSLQPNAPFGPGSLQPSNTNQLAAAFGINNGLNSALDSGTTGSGSGGGGGGGALGGGGGGGGSGGGSGIGSDSTSINLLGPDSSIQNSTGGPPVFSTTLPPNMCQCSWI